MNPVRAAGKARKTVSITCYGTLLKVTEPDVFEGWGVTIEFTSSPRTDLDVLHDGAGRFSSPRHEKVDGKWQPLEIVDYTFHQRTELVNFLHETVMEPLPEDYFFPRSCDRANAWMICIDRLLRKNGGPEFDQEKVFTFCETSGRSYVPTSDAIYSMPGDTACAPTPGTDGTDGTSARLAAAAAAGE